MSVGRLVFASVILFAFTLIWDSFIGSSKNNATEHTQNTQIKSAKKNTEKDTIVSQVAFLDVQTTLKNTNRIYLHDSLVNGAVSARGARIDYLELSSYKTSINHDAKSVVLLSPIGTESENYVEIKWNSSDASLQLPDQNTIWLHDSSEFSKNTPAILHWKSDQGVNFQIVLKYVGDYVIKVESRVENHSGRKIMINSAPVIHRRITGNEKSTWMFHEGGITMSNGTSLNKIGYQDIDEHGKLIHFDKNYKNRANWVGFMDKYWGSALIFDGNIHGRAHIYKKESDVLASFNESTVHVMKDNDILKFNFNIFAGAKNLDILEDVSKNLHAFKFDNCIDFGMLYMIPKSLIKLLDYFYSIVHNYGIAIVMTTIVVRILVLPLSIKAQLSVIRMQKLSPLVSAIKNKLKSDKVAANKEIMRVFRKNNVSPFAGMLPNFVQIPIFIGLYRALSISIDVRHAKFILWLSDLSSPDPSNIFSILEDVLNVNIEQYLHLSVSALLLAGSMYLQNAISMRYRATTGNDDHAMIMKIMPIAVAFLFSSFPVGLMLYWIVSNCSQILLLIYMNNRCKNIVIIE